MRTTVIDDPALDHAAYGDELFHYGVKGMKWGKHKSRLATFVDQQITGASAKKAMEQNQAEADLHREIMNEARSISNDYGKQMTKNVNTERSATKSIAENVQRASDSRSKAIEAERAANQYRKQAESTPTWRVVTKNTNLQNAKKADAEAVQHKKNVALYERQTNEALSKASNAKESYQKNLSAARSTGNVARSAESNMHQAQAQAASAKRAYGQSLAGKVSNGIKGYAVRRKEKSTPAITTKKTITTQTVKSSFSDGTNAGSSAAETYVYDSKKKKYVKKS